MKRYAITTKDNPYDPFTQFKDWWLYDIDHGYNTCQYLARMTKTSDLLSDYENNEEIGYAIDRIVAVDPLNIYRKLVIEDDESLDERT